jgi:hypothetical protein
MRSWQILSNVEEDETEPSDTYKYTEEADEDLGP